jgi:hypothetical protein
MPTTPKHDPTPPFARQLLDLYADAMAEVRFPDLDLARLLAVERELVAAQLELEQAEAALEAVRSARDAQARALNDQAERALAYAKIFAAGDEELASRLAELGRRQPGSASSSTQPRKRGRPPKPKGDAAELFGQQPVEPLM